ncbi:MAG: ribonuclease H family protein [Lachnospiraceae bacterium]|nr:ribonuclease H family protein [Lachnospiraceae bacterium]
MARKKVYAVKKGRETGIFSSWDACRASVDGYAGAQYKSFYTREEADPYLSGAGNPMQGAAANADADQIVAYVDGSFHKDLKKYSFGCILIKPDGGIVRESGNGSDPESLALRNVTGEMLGAMFAVKWCEVNGYAAVKICYDYMGIEMWATGGWKTNNSLTQKYAAFMRERAGRMHISFQKIAAHTGDKYNEEADRLAKAALVAGDGIPKIRKE